MIKLLLKLKIRRNTKGVGSNLTFLVSSWTLTSDCRASDPVSIKPGKLSDLTCDLSYGYEPPGQFNFVSVFYLSFIKRNSWVTQMATIVQILYYYEYYTYFILNDLLY